MFTVETIYEWIPCYYCSIDPKCLISVLQLRPDTIIRLRGEVISAPREVRNLTPANEKQRVRLTDWDDDLGGKEKKVYRAAGQDVAQ